MSSDQADVEAQAAIARAIGKEWNKTAPWCGAQDTARAIIDAIRNGEVPGVYQTVTYEAQLQVNAELRAEVERLEKERDTAVRRAYAYMERMDTEKARADKAEAANKLLIDELIPVGWEVLTSSGCPRCGCDVVAEPAMDGDGFVDGNPARCQSCGLAGQVTCDDDGAYFSADDGRWEIEEVAKRADTATAERDKLARLLRECLEFACPNGETPTSDLATRIDAALAEVRR
jgi:hypothetical protein